MRLAETLTEHGTPAAMEQDDEALYQFAALGALLYRNALKLGVGRELPTDWFTEDVNP